MNSLKSFVNVFEAKWNFSDLVAKEILTYCRGQEILLRVLQDQLAEKLRIHLIYLLRLLWLVINRTQSTFSRSPGTSASVPILMSPDASSTSYPAGRPTTILTSSKRAATSQHPWRLKKGKQKKTVKQQFYPKAVHLLDKPLEEYIGLDVICKQRVWVFHQGIQTRENCMKHERECFIVFECLVPWWNTRNELFT
jgi:hypothetical protein